MNRLQLNAFQLKLFALVIMTIDHIAYFEAIPMDPVWNTRMRIVGRIAAPLFLYLVTEGLRHTRSKPRYILRLYIAGTAVAAVNVLIMLLMGPGMPKSFGNIFHTFFYVALFVYCLEILIQKQKSSISRAAAVCGLILPFLLTLLEAALIKNHFKKAATVINIFLPFPLMVEYSLLFVLLGLVWYFVGNQYINCGIFAVFCLLSLLVPSSVFDTTSVTILTYMYSSFYELFHPYQTYAVMAIPFLLLYNGEKGRDMKYFFYFYYPLHQYLLFVMGMLL